MSFATKKISDLTTLAVASASIEFVINNAGVDYKLLMSGARITSSQITDFTGATYSVTTHTHTSDKITDYSGSAFATSPNTHSLDDLTDVVITASNTGDVLYYNGSNWIDLTRGASDQVLTSSTTSIVWAVAQGGLSNHNLYSAAHPDTVSQSVTTGDVLIGGSTASWTVLDIGVTNDVLTVISGLPEWQTTLTAITHNMAGAYIYAGDATGMIINASSNTISNLLLNGTMVSSVVGSQGLNLNTNYIFSGGATGITFNGASNTVTNIGFGQVTTSVISQQTTLASSAFQTTTDYILIYDGSSSTLAKATISGIRDRATIYLRIASPTALSGTGIAGDIPMGYSGYIDRAEILSDGNASGSCSMSVWKDTYANYPPTIADTIIGATNTWTISNNIKASDDVLSSWVTSFTAGDIFRFNLDGVSTFTSLTFALRTVKQ